MIYFNAFLIMPHLQKAFHQGQEGVALLTFHAGVYAAIHSTFPVQEIIRFLTSFTHCAHLKCAKLNSKCLS